MPSGSEVLGNRAIRGQKALGMPCGLEPLHPTLPLACRPMRVLTAVVEIAALAVFDPGQDLALGRAIALELIGDDDAWHVLQPLKQLAKELLRGLLIAPALHEDIQHVIILVDSAPQVMALPVDPQEHLVQVPLVTWLGAAVLQLIGVVLPKFQTPLADGFMGDVDAALAQELFHVAIAQREAIIEPDPVANDLAGEAVILVALGVC